MVLKNLYRMPHMLLSLCMKSKTRKKGMNDYVWQSTYFLDSIRSVVNVDACGTTGREILFQANSREMVEAYKQVPYPHGTVMVAYDCIRKKTPR